MPALDNPALKAFASHLGAEFLLAQVLIRRSGEGYQLWHTDDRDTPAEQLRVVRIEELRSLAQFTASGAFRPLKSAPNLQRGWTATADGDTELERALNLLYPGAVSDWFATRSAPSPVTHYREFTQRQTGMYRITTMLTDAQAGRVIRACCHRHFCLKRRLWTLTGLASDAAEEKSAIPCLEPCAVLLEFARKAMRLEQEDTPGVEISSSDAAADLATLEKALENPDLDMREADFDSPDNPRRLRLAWEKLREKAK